MPAAGRRLVACLVTLLAVALVAPVQATLAADARPMVGPSVDGNDFSWPQCPKGIGNGQGQPLPRGHRLFMIVGLSNGTGLHENPCLASQWAFAREHADHVTGYTVPTYPTRAERRDARTGHFGRCFHLRCRLRNSGWAQGQYAAASLESLHAHPPLVWVDVETRYRHPWTGHPSRNRLVVKAVIASLGRAGYRVGIYSTNYMWHRIVNYETRLPEWVPAGSTKRGCFQPISRGPVWFSQWGHYYKSGNGYDENGLCRRAPALHRMFERV
jgi:hypothetical protein